MATPTTLPASFVSGAVLTASQMNNLRGAFRILQVIQTVKTNTFTTTSTTYTDLTGMSATITPTSTSSLVLVVVDLKATASSDAYGLQLYRGTTQVYMGDADGNRTRVFAGSNALNAFQVDSAPAFYLDNPATTSATTYKVQIKTSANTAYVNRGATDANDANNPRTASSITLFEVSA